jgi:hypothetical protein
MSEYRTDHVRAERSGWRDESISNRHREWGFNCPAVDLDFLVAEYNFGKPVALVEYKHERARARALNINHPTYSAIAHLANGYNKGALPFIVAYYWPDIWAFRVRVVNAAATDFFTNKEVLCERDYVERLYRMRRMTIENELAGKLNTLLPEEEMAVAS